MLGIFSCFGCRLLTFFKINFFKKFFQERYQSGKRFDSRSWGCPSSGSKLSADDKSRRLTQTVTEPAKKAAENVVCLKPSVAKFFLLQINFNLHANSMDPDQKWSSLI